MLKSKNNALHMPVILRPSFAIARASTSPLVPHVSTGEAALDFTTAPLLQGPYNIWGRACSRPVIAAHLRAKLDVINVSGIRVDFQEIAKSSIAEHVALNIKEVKELLKSSGRGGWNQVGIWF